MKFAHIIFVLTNYLIAIHEKYTEYELLRYKALLLATMKFELNAAKTHKEGCKSCNYVAAQSCQIDLVISRPQQDKN